MRVVGLVNCKINFASLLSRLSRGTELTNQNENAKFVLPFTKPTTMRFLIFLLTDIRMTRLDLIFTSKAYLKNVWNFSVKRFLKNFSNYVYEKLSIFLTLNFFALSLIELR